MKKKFENLLEGAVAGLEANAQQILDKIIVRKEFQALICPLTDEELSQLEINILQDGVRDPIVIWPNGSDFILIDGHNRFSICKKHGLQCPIKKISFKGDEEAFAWMIKNQLGRRNLTKQQLSYLRGSRYLREKSQGRRTDITSDQSEQKSIESTASTLGKEYSVSEATIRRDGDFAAGVDLISIENPKLKEEILKGRAKLPKGEVASLTKKQLKSQGEKGLQPNGKQLSTSRIADLALIYVKTEIRSFEEVCILIGSDPTVVQAKEYFIKWQSLK